MGDSVQEQLSKLFDIVLAEQQANKERAAQMAQMHSKMDSISTELEAAKQARQSSSIESQAKSRNDKQTSGTSNSDTSDGSSMVPKFTKLNFPRYDGTEDPLGWISRCRHFFRHQHTPEEEKVDMASYHLDGIAQVWLLQFTDEFPDPTWAKFEEQCHLRFGPSVRSNKLGELSKLRQLGSVTDYQNHFEALVSRAGALTQKQKVDIYISGLQEAIGVEVELHHPPDLATAMSMSRLYERKLFPRTSNMRETRRNFFPSDVRGNRVVKN